MHDKYTIEWSDDLGMWVMKINDVPMMKNKKRSQVAKKLWKWLDSQGM